MDKQKKLSLSMIAAIIGFMIAIQFQTVQKPVVRDTRDTWQLREDLMKAKELQSKLLLEITSNEDKLAKYETKRKQSKESALRETLEELKAEAGLKEVSGPGVVILIEPVYEKLVVNREDTYLSPDLLKRLINEINKFHAKHISIAGQRLINTTVIRDINGQTKMNGQTLIRFPIEIRVVTETIQNAEKLYNQMQVSNTADEFFIDNLRLTIKKPVDDIVIPAYDDTIRIQFMKPVK